MSNNNSVLSSLQQSKPTSPTLAKNSVSSSELLSMLKKSKDSPPATPPEPSPPINSANQLLMNNQTPGLTQLQLIDDRGMLGLLAVIKGTGTAVNMASVGVDLEGLGLALDSADPVTKEWESPWISISHSSQAQSTQQPHQLQKNPCYTLPSNIAANPAAKLPHFADESLLYIFYALPKDRLQELAARELTARAWRYHRDLQQWLTVEGSGQELGADARCPGSKIFTVYFDVPSWTRSRRETLIERDEQIEDRFLQR